MPKMMRVLVLLKSEYYIEQIFDEADVSEYEINAEKVVIIN